MDSIVQLFGGANNLSNALAALGGIGAILTFFLSPVLAVIMKQSWSTTQKNILVYAACFVLTGVSMYFSGAFTGSLLDVGTWLAVWPLLIAGTTSFHDKIWGTDGTGVSTWIENNVLPGTKITFPTNKAELKDTATQLSGEAIDKLAEVLKDYVKDKIPSAAQGTPNLAGVAGAVPTEPTAQFGGPTIPENPLLGTIYDNPAAPQITPAPSVQAQVEAVTQAILTGKDVSQVVDNYEPIAG